MFISDVLRDRVQTIAKDAKNSSPEPLMLSVINASGNTHPLKGIALLQGVATGRGWNKQGTDERVLRVVQRSRRLRAALRLVRHAICR